MKKITASEMIYVNSSRIKNAGRGVYAKRNIKIGEVIEECPVIEIPKHDTASLEESILVTYFFFSGKNKEKISIALGFGSIYNHTYNPNAKYEIKSKNNMINFTAIKNIKKDDEITINYNNGSPKDKRPLWLGTI
jgi:SET domain-containing protein